MESNAMFRYVVSLCAPLVVVVLLCAAAGHAAFAQAPTTFEGTASQTDVPHYLWGKKPQEFMDEMTKKYGIPREAVLGFPETPYPEYRQKMKATSGP